MKRPWRDWGRVRLEGLHEDWRRSLKAYVSPIFTLMLKDPSGNLIEVKAYRHPEAVLGVLAGS